MKETDLAMRINNETYADYLDRLKLLATSLFTWEGLDEIAGTGASRFLELSLYEYGRACFIKDDELGYMALRVNPSDTFNVYMLPTKVQAWSIGYQKNFDFDDVVYIMNNELQVPTARTINQFAYRLYETERTIDVNLIAQKTPVLIEGDTKTILTLKNVYMQYSGNTPFIFGSKAFDVSNKLNVLNTNAPYLIDKLELHKHEIWNECLTFLGIDNANTDKKERLITDEVTRNQGGTIASRYSRLECRRQACKQINEMFHLNIQCDYREDYQEIVDAEDSDSINVDERDEVNE